MTVANHVTRSPPSAISSRLSQTIRHHVPSQRHTPNCMISLSIMPLYPATSRHIPVYQSICPPTQVERAFLATAVKRGGRHQHEQREKQALGHDRLPAKERHYSGCGRCVEGP